MRTSKPFRSLSLLFVALSSPCASQPAAQSSSPVALDGQAVALHGKRYLEVRVGIHIDAPPATVWKLLTTAETYTKWNSTIISLDGKIAADQTIALVAKVDPKRTFKLKVSRFEPEHVLVWQDGGWSFKGVRTFTLNERTDGTTDVTMTEVFTGAMMGMIESKLPDFRPSFHDFVADLKRAAMQKAAMVPAT